MTTEILKNIDMDNVSTLVIFIRVKILALFNRKVFKIVLLNRRCIACEFLLIKYLFMN